MNKKIKKEKISNEFKQLKTKIFIRTGIMVLTAIVSAFIVYNYVIRGNFANVVVNCLNFFLNSYDKALDIYIRVFRNYFELYVMMGILLIFLIFIRLYLREFTKYFNEINRGIDALLDENSDEVVLSAELVATEKKINFIKNSLKQSKLETELAEKRKNDLVMYLAHDLKTPLSSVIGYLTLLRDEQQISDELRERYLSISLDKAERLEDLINEFFEITRFNISNIELQCGRINFSRMLEQIVYEFKPMLIDKGLNCEIEIEPDIILYCDANKLQRVIDNLLRNANNYSYENTSIKLIAVKKDNYVCVKVVNEGNTIPIEKLERIFEQFYRLDAARSTSSGGAGLGLAIAKEIVELHHGTITADSNDGITCFEILLPLS